VPSNGQDFPLDQRTFYSLLRDAGYHVAGCGKFDLHKATEDWGLDGKRLLPDWGFSDGIDNAGKWDGWRNLKAPTDPYNAFLQAEDLADVHYKDFATRRNGKGYSNTSPTPLPEHAYCDNWIANNGLNLLSKAPKGKPWFLQVNFSGPHDPMDITRQMERLCRGRSYAQPNRCEEFSPEVHVAIRQNYSAMVENIDRWLGTYLEAIDKRGELENTLIVFSSDHGEMLGDHTRWAKAVPYHPSVSVPLVVQGPGVKKGVATDALASVMDLAATYLDYGGVRRPDDMDSRSLRPLLEGKTQHHRQQVLSGLYGWRMVWDGRYKLITGFDPDSGPREPEKPRTLLFDLTEDPLENHDLTGEIPDKVQQLAVNLPRNSRPAHIAG
jgi:arylsulfatase A-like enzyme